MNLDMGYGIWDMRYETVLNYELFWTRGGIFSFGCICSIVLSLFPDGFFNPSFCSLVLIV